MLGQDIDRVGWPRCGEIDVMENFSKDPTVVPDPSATFPQAMLVDYIRIYANAPGGRF